MEGTWEKREFLISDILNRGTTLDTNGYKKYLVNKQFFTSQSVYRCGKNVRYIVMNFKQRRVSSMAGKKKSRRRRVCTASRCS